MNNDAFRSVKAYLRTSILDVSSVTLWQSHGFVGETERLTVWRSHFNTHISRSQ